MTFLKTLITRMLLLMTLLFLGGCNFALFDPKGPIAEGISSTMIYTVLLMLIVVIPTIILSVYIPYRFRDGSKGTKYKPNWSHSTLIEIIVWGIPIVIVLFLATEAYKTAYSLDPRKAIESDKAPLKIQVVSLDWKWLFIYPEEGVASINELSIPVDRPVEFLITSDSSMNSFFIPRLGSQLYAMTGMENRLNLMATEAGVYKGFSSNYSGFGFSGMRFKTYATDEATHQQWVEKVRAQGVPLDDKTYAKLVEKSRDNPVEYFVNSDPLRFKNIIQKYSGLLNIKPSTGKGAHANEVQHGQQHHDSKKPENTSSHD